MLEVIAYSARLDPFDNTTIDISPAAIGNNTLGTNDGNGHRSIPSPPSPIPNLVNRATSAVSSPNTGLTAQTRDTARPLNKIANEVAEHPLFARRLAGLGTPLSPLEWDVKLYFLLNAALHDAAIAAWDCKRTYDYVRPIGAIRYTGGLGQLDSSRASYHPDGLPLVDALVEEITTTSSTRTAPRPPRESYRRNCDLRLGRRARRSKDPVYRSRLDTRPRLAALSTRHLCHPRIRSYVSGHSTFSRAAAEVLTRITGVPTSPEASPLTSSQPADSSLSSAPRHRSSCSGPPTTMPPIKPASHASTAASTSSPTMARAASWVPKPE